MSKVLIVGECCVDEFVYGKATRLSPEGPAPVFIESHTIRNGGMAYNVMQNLNALGCTTDLVTNTQPITKKRYIEENFNHLLLRVDIDDNVPNIGTQLSTLNFYDFDMVVISDYNKGFLSDDDIAKIAFNHPNTICDTKKKLGDWCTDLKFIKLNRTEYQNNKSFIENNEWILEKLIITLDKDGCMYLNNMYPTEKVEIMDISGAGDTFVAGFTKKYLETFNINDSIIFGNRCSSQVIQKRGVSVISNNFI
jgi:D-beta-D-heptose 7-phosphate kinase/D-beta-D-heptose 1-phosphate adenosyltransferase